MKLNNKVKSALSYVIVLTIALTAGVVWKQLSKPSPEEMRQELIAEIVKRLNEETGKLNYPRRIDEETQWDSFHATPHGVYYKYTLFYSGDFASLDYTQIKKNIARSICSDKTIRQIMNYGLPYIYEYYKPNKQRLFSIEITRRDCYQY